MSVELTRPRDRLLVPLPVVDGVHSGSTAAIRIGEGSERSADRSWSAGLQMRRAPVKKGNARRSMVLTSRIFPCFQADRWWLIGKPPYKTAHPGRTRNRGAIAVARCSPLAIVYTSTAARRFITVELSVDLRAFRQCRTVFILRRRKTPHLTEFRGTTLGESR